jgi:hypothetical protein
VERPRNAGEIKRHPEVETLLATGDNRTEVTMNALNRPKGELRFLLSAAAQYAMLPLPNKHLDER